jgi:hypothetical protein
LSKIARWLLPNPGTILLIGVLLWAQSAGALPLGQQAASTSTSTTTIHYQGRLANSEGTPIDGLVTLQFALYATDVDPSPVWGPETHPNVPVSEGLFAVRLGAMDDGIPQEILGGDLWLEIIVEGETLSPRERLGSVPYAMQALTVPDGAIGSRNMAPTVFSAFTSSETPLDGETEVLSLDVDFPLDATYLFIVRVSSAHDSVGRIISGLHDESGDSIPGGSLHTRHETAGNDGSHTGSVTTVADLSAGHHTIRLVSFANGGTGTVRSAHVIAIPFAHMP